MAERFYRELNPDARIASLTEAVRVLSEALEELVGMIDAAGLHNLTKGVQLGPTVWFVKCSDAMDASRAALTTAKELTK